MQLSCSLLGREWLKNIGDKFIAKMKRPYDFVSSYLKPKAWGNIVSICPVTLLMHCEYKNNTWTYLLQWLDH